MRTLMIRNRQSTLSVSAAVVLLLTFAYTLVAGGSDGAHHAVALVGLAIVVLALALPALSLLRAHRSVIVALVLAALVLAWFALAAGNAASAWPPGLRIPDGALLSPYLEPLRFPRGGLPWPLGRGPVLALFLVALCATCGFMLIADSVRVFTGSTRSLGSSWRLLSHASGRSSRSALRAIPGVILIAIGTVICLILVDNQADRHPVLALVLTLVVLWVALLTLASPVAVGLATRLDLDRVGSAREQERQRLAAHLHDSVLQTLALIQRQASDTRAVAKLARRQEHALRAWMAGEAELGSATLAGALRDLVGEVEDQYGITVEFSAISDVGLTPAGDELIAAAREALRNVALHAPDAAVNLLLDTSGGGVEVFIRDDGPGFDVDAVPPQRRGLRDAVIGRMAAAGGSASVESNLGEGTEVTLRLSGRKLNQRGHQT